MVGQYDDLEVKKVALLDLKPVEADECVNDVLGAPNPANEPCCSILHRLKTANQVGWQPRQHIVAVIKSAENKPNDQRLKNSRRYLPSNIAQLR